MCLNNKVRTILTCAKRMALAAGAAAVVAGSANAATYTWKTVSGQTAANWDVSGNWTTANFPNAAGDIANLNVNFPSTITITLGVPVTVGRINIGDSASTFRRVTLTGSDITFDATSGNAILNKASTGTTQSDRFLGNIVLADSLDATVSALNGGILFNGNISETTVGSGLTKLGNGTLTMSGTNTYTGPTTVSAGLLNVTMPTALYNSGAAAVWSDANIVVGTGAMLNLSIGGAGFSDADIQTISGLGSGSGGFAAGSFLGLDTTAAGDTTVSANLSNVNDLIVVKTGDNKLTLTGNNSVRLAVQSGTLQLATKNSLQSGNSANWTADNFGVASGATAQFSVGGAGEFSAADISTIGMLGTATGGFQDGSIIAIDTSNAAGNTTIATGISDTNAGANSIGLTKTGPNALVLAAANTYTGPTNLSGGELILSDSNALQNSAFNNTGGTLTFNSSVASHQFTIGALVGFNSIDMHDNAANSINLMIGNSSGDFGGTLSGSGNLTKIGDGTQTFSGFNTFTGHTTINGGVMQYTSDGAIGGTGGADITVNAGGTAAAAYSFGIDQSFLARVEHTSTGVVALGSPSFNVLDFSAATGANMAAVSLGATGNYTFSGSITPYNNTYRLGGGGGNLTMGVPLVAGNSLVLDTNGTSPDSKVTLNQANAHDGGTILNSGTVIVGNDAAFGTGSVTLNGGKIDTAGAVGATYTIANPIVVNGLTKIAAAGTNSSTRENIVLSGPITGSGTLSNDTESPDAASHSANITLSGNLSGFAGTIEHYAYDTTGGGTGSPTANILFLAQASAPSATYGGVYVQDYSNLRIVTHGATNYSSNGRSIRIGDSAAGSTVGVIQLGEVSGDGGLFITQGGDVVAKQVVEVGAKNTDASYAGGFRENSLMDFVKTGSGSLTLSGRSSYEGTSTVRSGTLVLAADAVSTNLGNRGADSTTDTLFDNLITVTAATDEISYTDTQDGYTPYVNGDRILFGWSSNPGTVSATTAYYVRDASATSFKVSLTPDGDPINFTSDVSTSGNVRSYKFGSLGSSDTPVELGDTGTETGHLATTGSETVSLLTGGPVTVYRPVNVNDVGAGSTIGGNTDNASTFAGAIALSKNLTVSQIATTGGNALAITGGMSAASAGAKTVTFAGPGAMNVSTLGIDNGSGTVGVIVAGGSLALNAANGYSGATTVNSGATLGGTGSIDNSALAVNAGGILAPGSGVGDFSVGSANLSGTLAIQYNGDTNSIDKLIVAGALNLTSATIDFANLGSAALSGSSFVFASYGSLGGSGMFSSVLDLPAGFSIDYHFGGNQIALVSSGGVAGDFDSDGDVDGADFIAWQTHYPTTGGATLATGDANGDGNVNGADFALWQNGFPTSPSATAVVPEPGALALAALAAGAFGLCLRCRR